MSTFISKLLSEYPNNIVLAGGSLHKMHSRLNRNDKTDRDFFLIDYDLTQLNGLLSTVSKLYKEHFGDYFVMRTKFAITFFCLKSEPEIIQIIMYNYKNIHELLNTFDLDASCFCYDGKSIKTNCRGIRAMITGSNLVDVKRTSPSFAFRLQKYRNKYGFGIEIPGYIASRLVPKCSIMLDLHGLSQVCYSSFTYNQYTAIAKSGTFEVLKHNIRRLFRQHSNFPFILKYNHDILDVDEEEIKRLPTNFFSPVERKPKESGVWFAQAYGGEVIPEIKNKIANEVEKKEMSEYNSYEEWQLNLGKMVLEQNTVRL